MNTMFHVQLDTKNIEEMLNTIYRDKEAAIAERDKFQAERINLWESLKAQNKEIQGYKDRISALDRQFNAMRLYKDQLESTVKALSTELEDRRHNNATIGQEIRSKIDIMREEISHVRDHYQNALNVIADQDKQIAEKSKIIYKLKNIIVGQTDCSTECGAYGDLEKENKMLVEKMATLSKKIDHRNRVLREVVDSHRDFVRDIEASVKLEKGYDKGCINPILARLAGFKATKENRS